MKDQLKLFATKTFLIQSPWLSETLNCPCPFKVVNPVLPGALNNLPLISSFLLITPVLLKYII